jgi:hypothetical protein
VSTAHLNHEATTLYKQILHRAPTSTELAAAVAQLRAGAAQTDIMADLLTSTEYQNSHPTSSSLIMGFYADVLGEIPSSLTQVTLVQALGTQTLQQEVQGLLSTPDMYNQIVTDGFYNILRRPPTSAELQNWSGQLQTGTITQAQFQQQLLTSSEFQQLCVRRIQGL